MGVFRKGQKMYSISQFKCPKCHEGSLFPTATFSFSKPFEMNKRCPVCQENFEPEPGFYYGAMFISYIFMGFFCLGFVMLLHWIIGWSITTSFVLLLLVCAIFFVYIFRLARAIWINIVINYNANKKR